MFSLIITIISIALVAALAIATVYYGGEAFSNGNDSARASEVMLQGQQVMGASDTFRAQNGRWPNTIEELVTAGYLKTVPAVSVAAAHDAGLLGTARADGATPSSGAIAWTMPAAGRPTFVLDAAVSSSVCQLVNQKSRGDNGILKKASTTLTSQCFGEAASGLTVVVSRESQDLAQALPAIKVTAAGVPTAGGVVDLTSPDWAVKPGGAPSGGADGEPAPPAASAGFTVQAVLGSHPTTILQQGQAVSMQGQSALDRWVELVVTNTAATPAVLNFQSTDDMGGWDWYSLGGSVEDDRAAQISQYGGYFCELGAGVLPAGGSCLVRVYLPLDCSTSRVEQIGPLTLNLASFETCTPVLGAKIAFRDNASQLYDHEGRQGYYDNQFLVTLPSPRVPFVQILSQGPADAHGWEGYYFVPPNAWDTANFKRVWLEIQPPPVAGYLDSHIEILSASATVSGPGVASATYPVTWDDNDPLGVLLNPEADGRFRLLVPVPGGANSNGAPSSLFWDNVEVSVTYQYSPPAGVGAVGPRTVKGNAFIVMTDGRI